MKTVVVIPTYDEKENVGPMAEAVLASAPDAELLFVDDNSPDGTGDVIEGLMKAEPRIHCLHRTKKEGLGRADWESRDTMEALFDRALSRASVGRGHIFITPVHNDVHPDLLNRLRTATGEEALVVLAEEYETDNHQT